MKGSYRFFFVLVFVALITTKGAFAAKHVIGGSQGWDESVDFNSWTSGKTFKVGDELVFKYNSGLHSVVELGSEAAYKNCDLGTPLDSKSSGNDEVKLNKAGTRFFACGTLGHCDQGMKVKITTIASNSPSSPASSSSSKSGAYALQPFVGLALLVSVFATTSLLFMF